MKKILPLHKVEPSNSRITHINKFYNFEFDKTKNQKGKT